MAKSKPSDKESLDSELPTRALPALGVGNDPSADAEDQQTSEIDEMLRNQELDGGTLRLNRRGPTEQNFSYVAKMKIKDFDVDYIKKMYGGGDYRAQTWRANGQIYKSFEFSIDGRFTGAIDPKAAAELAGKGGNTAQDAMAMTKLIMDGQQKGPDMTQMLTMMQKSSSENMQMMMMMMQQSSQQMASMMQAMGQTMAAAMARPVGPANDSTATIMPVLIEMIRAGSNKGGGGAPSMLEQVETLKLLRELAMPPGGKDEEEEKEPSMMEKIAKVAMPMLFGNMGQMQLPAIPAAATQQAAPAAAQVQVNVTSEEKQKLDQTNTMMIQLLAAAERDADPGLYHDLTMETQAVEQLPQLKQLLEREDYLNILYAFDPAMLVRATTKKAWFDTLRGQLLESVAEALKPV